MKKNPFAHHKRSVGSPPISPLVLGGYNPLALKKSLPTIDCDGSFGGSSRKTSVGILGSGSQTMGLPAEFNDYRDSIPGMGNQGNKPCYKYSRQTSTSNECINYSDVRTFIKGPPGTEPQGLLPLNCIIRIGTKLI